MIKQLIVQADYDNNNNNNNNINDNNNNIIIIQNFIHRLKKIDYLQIQEYEILKYIHYEHSSCVRDIKIYTLCTVFLCTKENCRKMTIERLLITITKSIKKLIKNKKLFKK